MEHVQIILDDGTGSDFDKSIRGDNVLQDDGKLKIITKEKGTVEGNPIVALVFNVALPDGSIKTVQTVTTVRMFQQAAAAMTGRYGLV